MTRPRLILASGSPQRRRLMQEAGYPFEVLKPDDDAECGICSTGGPAAFVAEAARRKAQHIIERHQPGNAVLVACDTVAELNGILIGKPRDEDDAERILRQLSGTTHRVYSGLCVWRSREPEQLGQQVVVSELAMSRLSDEAIDAYLATGLWRGKAGAFGIQDRPDWLRIVAGSESNVIGLPMDELRAKLGDPGGYLPQSEG